MNINDLNKILDPMLYIGRCSEQVDEFLNNHVKPLLTKNPIREIEISLNV